MSTPVDAAPEAVEDADAAVFDVEIDDEVDTGPETFTTPGVVTVELGDDETVGGASDADSAPGGWSALRWRVRRSKQVESSSSFILSSLALWLCASPSRAVGSPVEPTPTPTTPPAACAPAASRGCPPAPVADLVAGAAAVSLAPSDSSSSASQQQQQ